MQRTVIIGIDIGKNFFHLVGRDKVGREVFRHKFNRAKLIQFLSCHEPVVIAMESCGGCHWLARKCSSFGHIPKLIPPQYVKPYVKSHKNDFIDADADAIGEAASRPHMRFVTAKSEMAQVLTVIRRVRAAYIKDRTACMNRISSMLLEFGISLPKGHHQMKNVFQRIMDHDELLPPLLLLEVKQHFDHYELLNLRIKEQEEKLQRLMRQQETAKLLQTIPGVSPITACCCLSAVANPQDFKNGRNFAAWIGLVPYQYSTGGKSRLLGISKRGNKELREMFVHAARAVMWRDESAEKYFGTWLIELKRRKPFNVAVVALANKLARIAWSVMAEQKPFEVRI